MRRGPNIYHPASGLLFVSPPRTGTRFRIASFKFACDTLGKWAQPWDEVPLRQADDKVNTVVLPVRRPATWYSSVWTFLGNHDMHAAAETYGLGPLASLWDRDIVKFAENVVANEPGYASRLGRKLISGAPETDFIRVDFMVPDLERIWAQWIGEELPGRVRHITTPRTVNRPEIPIELQNQLDIADETMARWYLHATNLAIRG